jgi:hypothetical protein
MKENRRWSKADARACLWERLEARREGPTPKFRAALISGWPFADSSARLVLKKIRRPA